MKGYLQRMAAVASTPDSALRPLVSAVFAQEPQPQAADEAALRHVSLGAEASEPASTLPSETGTADRVETLRAQTPLVEPNSDPARRIRKILLPQTRSAPEAPEPEDLFSPKTFEAAEMQNRDALPAQTNQRSQLLKFRPLVAREEEQPGPAEHPRISRAEIDPARWEPPNNLKPPTHALGQVTANPAQSRDVSRAGEDIRIHIGRIEVIAVPPPVHRAPSAAAHAGESLAEYLRRRDRRPR